jgi:hypothetical protein
VRIEVEASQDQGIEIPRTFRLNVDRIEVVEVLDQWYGSDYRYCKVKGGDGALYILRLDVERVLANIDASYGDCGVEFRRHSVLLVFGTPCQRNLLAGQEHGRTIPLAEVECAPRQSRTIA